MKMRHWCGMAGCLLLHGALLGDVVISEILYNSPHGGSYEFLELHNTDASTVDIGGWSFTSGITYIFPAGATIPASGYVVLCRSKASIREAYPSLSDEILFGDYNGAIANEGETLTLSDPGGTPVETFTYDDDSPWEFLADGFGASLERICYTADASLPENWRAGATPASPEEFGGSPGAANSTSLCPPEAPSHPRVLISEIMYHPVLEEAFEDNHEFIEIHNADVSDVDLSGWRIAGAVDYTFPPASIIAPSGYAVIAKSRSLLADVSAYGLSEIDLYGDYARTLDNGGEKVALISDEGQGIDSVSYDDDFPWAIGADALGAGRTWLRSELLPLEDHRYLGHSLERVSFDFPSNAVVNWAPSPLDGATPGLPNASARSTPLPIVEDILVLPSSGEERLIRSSDEVLIQVRFSTTGAVTSPVLEYFIDDVAVTGETVQSVALLDDGTGGDVIAGDGTYSRTLPARPDNSIVRYRISGNRGPGFEVISPRPTDPNAWHAYFVNPVINTQTRVYQLFIAPAGWTRLWDNITGGRVSGCAESSSWNEKEPAVFVHNGTVYDAHVRYQGSRWNRTNGRTLSSWPHPGPARPSPVKALSWRIALPRYNQLGGRSVVTLNKLSQACPGGFTSGLGYRLFAEADLPASETRYIRFHINGGYYHYMMEYERPGEDLLRRYHSEQEAKYPEEPREPVGHLFKSAGCTCDEGPFGWGDERLLGSYCGHSATARYQATYDRKTHEWDSHDEFISMIEDLHAARAAGQQALRDYFAERFDLDLLLNYVAIINYQVPFDDMFQNHFLYQRRSDGLWLMVPWDLDRNFGGWQGADSSLYMGEQGDPGNRSGWWNRVKDALLVSYRPEYEERLLLLNNTILHPDNINAILDEVEAEANPTEANSAPAGACSFSSSGIRSFAAARFQIINDELSAVRVDAGPDQTVLAGTIVQFDASASRPDPGAGVTYVWDNGMTGDRPSRLYSSPGVFVVTLTVTVDGTPYTDSVTISVVPAPETAFVETGGQVVVEAESFYLNESHGATEAWWSSDTSLGGYSGSSYMVAEDTSYQKYSSDYADTAPELRYTLLFETTGVYRVWIRGLSGSNAYDSCHVGLDGQARDESFAQRFVVDPGTFLWTVNTRSQGPQTVNVATPGVHFLSIWIRESGQIIDKIILTRDGGFTPTGLGAPESTEVNISSTPAFIRGDANRDGGVDISDGVAVLFHLFTGSSALTCEDHGDADDDGSLSVTDAIHILSFLFQEGPAPVAPYPDPGWDTTPDGSDCGDG